MNKNLGKNSRINAVFFAIPVKVISWLVVGIFALISVGLVGVGAVVAASSDEISFQGKIVQNDSTNTTSTETTCIVDVGADTCDFKVSYYDDAVGTTLLGSETFANVEIGDYDGVFNLSLGSQTFTAGSESSFDALFSGNYTDLHIKVEFAPDGTTLTEDFGLMALRAVPYALNSKYLGGKSADDFLHLASGLAQTDSTTNSSIFVNKTGLSGSLLQLQAGGSDEFTIGYDGVIDTASVDSTSIVDGSVAFGDWGDNGCGTNEVAQYNGSAWVCSTLTLGSTTFLGLSDTPGAFTPGSILFTSSSAVTEDNSNFYWDNTNKRLGIGTASPTEQLHVEGTGILSALIKTTTVGTTNSAALRIDRGDLANGYAGISLHTAGVQDWTLNVPAGTSDLRLYSHGAGVGEMVRFIRDTGDVSIGGIDGDIAKLAVQKDTSVLTNENSYAIKIVDGTDDVGLVLGVSATDNISIIQSLDTSTGWVTRPLALMPNGGNVGIGTVTPTGKLDVAGSIAVTNYGSLVLGATDAVSEGAQINMAGAASYDTWVSDIYTNNYRLFANSTNDNYALLFNAGTGQANMNIEGNLAIGVYNSTAANRLQVQGVNGGSAGVYLNSAVPSSTTYTLYNNAGTLYWNGSALGSGGASTFLGLSDTPSSYQTGSVLFATSSAVSQDNHLYWDPANERLGVGTNSGLETLTVFGYELPFSATRNYPTNGSSTIELMRLTQSYTGGAGSDGIGGYISFMAETETLDISSPIARVAATTTDATAGTIDAYVALQPYLDGSPVTDALVATGTGVGIGTTTPAGALHVNSATGQAIVAVSSESSYSALQLFSSSDTNWQNPYLMAYRSRGTRTSPTAILGGDYIFTAVGYGYDGSTYSSAGGINYIATENWSGTNMGSKIQFVTNANATTTGVVRMTIDQSGNVGIGTGSAAPSLPLTVVGATTPFQSNREYTTNGTSTVELMQLVRSYNGGAGADGIGGYITFYAETETEGTNQPIGIVRATATDATAGTIDSYVSLQPYLNGATVADALVATGSGVGIGTNAPDYELHVTTSIANDYATYIRNGSGDGYGLLVQAYSSSAEGHPLLSLHRADGEVFNVSADGTIYINTGTPAATTNRLYNNAGTLFWNGSAVGSGGSSTFLGLTDTPSSYSAGSILFATSSSVSQDNHLYWDSANDRLGIGDNGPTSSLSIFGSTNDIPITAVRNYSTNGSSTVELMRLTQLYTGGAASDGIGGYINFYAETETSGISTSIGRFAVTTTDATAGTIDSYVSLQPFLDGSPVTDAFAVTGTGVGIGTTTPARKLDILDATNAQLRLSSSSTVYSELKAASDGKLYLSATDATYTANLAFVPLSWSDWLLLGQQDSGDYGYFEVAGSGTGAAGGGHLVIDTAADYDTTITSYIVRAYQDNLHIGPSTDNDALSYYGSTGGWNFTSGNVGIGRSPASSIALDITSLSTSAAGVRIVGNTSGGTLISLYEDADGDSLIILNDQTGTTRTQIRSDQFDSYISAGFLGIGLTDPEHPLHVYRNTAGASVARFQNDASNGSGVIVQPSGDTTPSNSVGYLWFFDGANGTDGSIKATGSGGVVYNTTSDARLKTNLTSINDAVGIVMQMNPTYYEMKQAPGITNVGFLAQELQVVYPYAVSGNPTDDVKTNPMMVDYSKLTPILTAAIQEQQLQLDLHESELSGLSIPKTLAELDPNSADKLTTLQTKVTELENAISNLDAGASSTYLTFTPELISASTALYAPYIYGDTGVYAILSTNSFDAGTGNFTVDNDGYVLMKKDLTVEGQIFGLSGILNIGDALYVKGSITTPGLIIDLADVAGATAGSAVIPAGEVEIVIETTSILPDAKVFVTPTTDTFGEILTVVDKTDETSFTVKINNPQETDIGFDWWIVNVTDSSIESVE